MSRKKVPVIAITETEIKEFDSVKEAADFYGLHPANLITLIKTGQVHRDGRTCFDYNLEDCYER